MIESLKKLQDSLGDLHDVHVFAEELVAATEKAAGSRARRVSEVVLTVDEEESEEDRVRRARSRDPGPGLLGLARLLHERGMQVFAQIESDWLRDKGEKLFEEVDKFVGELNERAPIDDETEPTEPTSVEMPEPSQASQHFLDREVTYASNHAEARPARANGNNPAPQEVREDARI